MTEIEALGTGIREIDNNKEAIDSKTVILSSLLAKGRVTVWVILLGSFLSAQLGVFTGDQLLDVITFIGGLWLGGEIAKRK